MHGKRRGLVATTPWLAALLWLACGYASTGTYRPTASGADGQASGMTYHGTVQAVRPATGELDVLTGVGQALRLIRMRAADATVLTSAGQPIRLDQIQVGDIVRAECHHTDQELVMDRIEKLGRYGREPDGSGGRSP